MTIRNYQPGDEDVQAEIYNEAAAGLPGFKPATTAEVRRRVKARDFDPGTRLYAVDRNGVVGYAVFQSNGRVSYPWCRKGFEYHAGPLFDQLLATMRARGLRRALAAYRTDWLAPLAFFQQHGFRVVRQMVNYWLDPAEMPTPAARRSHPIGPARPDEAAGIFRLGAGVTRLDSAEAMGRYLFENPYFPPESVFVLRDRGSGDVLAAGLLVTDPAYADPTKLDAAMPCFRLGAFGSEGMTTKRINGLFSFLARDERGLLPLAHDLMGYAADKLDAAGSNFFAAQVPSDAAHLHRFYEQVFRRQGSFPVLERELGSS